MSKIKEMLKYVSEHNDFYKNIIKEHGITDPTDITQYPILTRQQLQENRYDMFSHGFKAKYLNYQLIRNSSSGTSGMPVSVYWEPSDYWKSMMSIWRKRQKWYDISPSDRFVTFTLPNASRNQVSKNVLVLETSYQLFINAASLASEEAYKIAIERIFSFEPKWIYIQPFILEQLIYYYKKFDFKPPISLVHIDSVGEVLTEQLKMSALDFFKVSLANLYGSEEHNGIAYECPHGKMHILDDNVYVENNSIITNVKNYAFPLIRYDQGDKIQLIAQQIVCKCGSSSQCISEIEGRISQSFSIADMKINTYSLSEVIKLVNNQFNGIITNYSFCYSTGAKLLKCDIKVRDERGNWKKSVICEIEKALYQRLPRDTGLRLCVVDQSEKFITNKSQILTITT